MPTGKHLSLVEVHTLRKHCKKCSRHPSPQDTQLFFIGLSFWNSIVYLELICTSFSVVCKATCLMHIFIMSDVLHLACVYLLYNVSFPIIFLLLHPSSSAHSVPVYPLSYSYISFSLLLLYTTYSLFRTVVTVAEFLFLLRVWSDSDSRRAFLCLPQASTTFSFSLCLSLSTLPHFCLSLLDSFYCLLLFHALSFCLLSASLLHSCFTDSSLVLLAKHVLIPQQ